MHLCALQSSKKAQPSKRVFHVLVEHLREATDNQEAVTLLCPVKHAEYMYTFPNALSYTTYSARRVCSSKWRRVTTSRNRT